MYQAFLLKYAEIGIKGKNRYKFENALCEQIRYRLEKIEGDFEVIREQGRIFGAASGRGLRCRMDRQPEEYYLHHTGRTQVP